MSILAVASPGAAQFFRGVNVSGAEFGENSIPGRFGQAYTYNSEQTFHYFAARNLKYIRLQIRWERLQPVLRGPLDPANLGYLKQNIAWAKAAGAEVAIEAHNYGRYKMTESGVLNEYIIDGRYNGSAKVTGADLVDFWVRISAEFQDEPTVAAYDIMNEPHDMGSSNWKQISQAVLTGIRAAGDNKTVMIPGDSWSSASQWARVHGASSWISDPADNFYYEAHTYFDHDNSGTYGWTYDRELAANPAIADIGVARLAPFQNWCVTNKVRCYLGEYGIPNNDPRWLTVLDRFLTALDAAGFPGTYWAAGEWWGNYALSVQPQNDFTLDRVQTPTLLAHLTPGAFTTVSSAASFGYAVAPGSLVTGYAAGIGPGADLQIQLTDSTGRLANAQVSYLGAGQVNYRVPADTPVGRVDVKVIRNGNPIGTGVLQVRPIAPTLFATAEIVRIGAEAHEYSTAPIQFGSDRLVMILYGTGFTRVSGLNRVVMTIGNLTIPVQYAGPQNQFPGLDQINAELPPALAGVGEVGVSVTVEGKPANKLTLVFR